MHIYTFSRIGAYNVVVACVPAGVRDKVSATTVAKDMMRSFPIKIWLIVGICGGVWSERVDIRLGDVVVSQPDGMHGGVV
jgi:nucleoside phosphorylase